MTDYLEYHGYSVYPLAHGACLFSAMMQFKPHIVLLDLKLPDIDGFTLLEQFRQKTEWQDIPVIVVSAFAFQSDQQRALSLGARQYLIKPVNLAQLRRTIHEELNILAD